MDMLKERNGFRILAGGLAGAVTAMLLYRVIAGPAAAWIVYLAAAAGGFAAGGFRMLRQPSAPNGARLLLRKEVPDVTVKKKPVNDVRIYKKITTEDKTVTVPLHREELVIEKQEQGNVGRETLRIPLQKEELQLDKKQIPINQVRITKNKIRKLQHVDTVIKEEKVRVETERKPPS
jgi:uncharacterized protein (TIGR02271 family)